MDHEDPIPPPDFAEPPFLAEPPLRRLPTDLSELTFAMDMAGSSLGMIHNYVDRETGEILFVSEDNLEECEEEVERIEVELERYVAVPTDDSRAAYRDREDFAETAEERWFRFRDERQTARAIAWLAEEGLAPAE
jgi:hypothetical protein